MARTVLNSKSFFIVMGITGFCSLALIAVHQPQQYSTKSSATTIDERLISLRVDDFIVYVSQKVMDGIRKKKLLRIDTGRIGMIVGEEESAGFLNGKKLPTIYIITPTYKRPEQIPDLTRLSHTLMNVPSIVWLIIEDAYVLNPNVAEIAKRSGIPFVHLIASMPVAEKNKRLKARGVSNRNRGLRWIRENYGDPDGVIYFADDDNTYDLRLFEEIRTVKRLGMFPVGLITGAGVSTPIVKKGIVTGFYDGWKGNRTFPVDMAGFAFSVELLLKNPKAKMPFIVGYEEDRFLQALKIKALDIEPKASNCTQIFVWHTKTLKNKAPVKLKGRYENTNIDVLYKFMES